MTSHVVVTGGAGFIGATLVRRLVARGIQVTIVDDLSQGHRDTVPPGVALITSDIVDTASIGDQLRARPPIDVIYHLAAKISVAESVAHPELYHHVNVEGTRAVIRLARDLGVSRMIAASSAAVLATPVTPTARLSEHDPLGPTSPYGFTKAQNERDLAAACAYSNLSVGAVRFFNAAGGDPAVPERHDPETHLIPLAVRATLGQLPPIRLFGTDFPTPDGTCVRDYVDVRDAADAMIAASDFLRGQPGFHVWNIGSGIATSVKEVLDRVGAILERRVPTVLAERRPGDPAALVCNPDKAHRELALSPRYNLDDMIRACAEGWAN